MVTPETWSQEMLLESKIAKKIRKKNWEISNQKSCDREAQLSQINVDPFHFLIGH